MDETDGSDQAAKRAPRLPPRWVIRTFWTLHRTYFRVTRGRGVSRPKPGKYGMLALTTVGRRTGEQRTAIVGYFEDGPNLVTLAMNGWAAPEPAWWLNLQAHPDVTVKLDSGLLEVRGRAAVGEERDRLWARWQEIDDGLDQFAARRPSETAVVVLEPRQDGAAVG